MACNKNEIAGDFLTVEAGLPAQATKTTLGGKTGNDVDALNCLATLAKLNGNEYLTVTMHAEPTATRPLPTGEDAEKIYSEIEKETNDIIEKEYR